MRTVRWGSPSEVAEYEFSGGRRYSEQEIRDLAASGRVRTEGAAGEPLRIGYVWVDEDGRSFYDLDWIPNPPTRISPAEDDPREWPIEPPQSAGGP